jgi:hypothetical protein
MRICNGDLLESKTDVIVQQCNCVTIKSHGLSNTIAKRYPCADIYSKRIRKSANIAKIPEIPGTCVISKQDGQPNIAALMGQIMRMHYRRSMALASSQICPGKPGQWCKVYDVDPLLDDAKKRLEYFKASLENLLSICRKENWKSVSFT